MDATVSEVCKPQAKWSVGGVPLCAFARPTPEGKVVIQPNLVDLNGETFREFSEQRQQWEIMDSFINPGPIQYDMMTRPKTVIADIAYMGALRQQVLQMCDQIKASCGVGANADYLHTAKESLSSLQRVLAIVSKYDVFAEAQKLQESVVTRHEPLTNLYASNKNPRAAAFTEDLDGTRNLRKRSRGSNEFESKVYGNCRIIIIVFDCRMADQADQFLLFGVPASCTLRDGRATRGT